VHDPVDAPVRDLRCPLVPEQVQRRERKRAKFGPGETSRISAGNRSRSVGTLEPRPASGRSQPNSLPTFQRSDQSVRAAPEKCSCGPPEVIYRTSRGKSSGPPGVGSAHTSSSRKPGVSSCMRQGREACAAFESFMPQPSCSFAPSCATLSPVRA
jgi:hypothetical protein